MLYKNAVKLSSDRDLCSTRIISSETTNVLLKVPFTLAAALVQNCVQ